MSRSHRDPASLDLRSWSRSSKRLGRSYLDPGNVAVSRKSLSIRIPADTLDGGEVESDAFFEYGGYRARLKLPNAPGSITGFFLYRSPDYASEIDVEIYNDSSGRILFSTYAGGAQTNTERMCTGFDPTAKVHEYGFDFYPQALTFYVDDEPMRNWSKGLPGPAMKLFLNVWFPEWLPGTRRSSDRVASVEWIRHYPHPSQPGHIA